MRITRVKVHLSSEDEVKAYVDITLDDCIIIHGLRLIRHDHGYLVAMPQRRWRKGGHSTIAYPSTPEARHMIEDAVMAEYLKKCRRMPAQLLRVSAAKPRSDASTRRL